MQSHMAIRIFKDMKLHGVLPDDMTYNIMIDCCSILRCFRSASALASMMMRCGYMPQNFTYTALIKVSLYTVLTSQLEIVFSIYKGNKRINLREKLLMITVLMLLV